MISQQSLSQALSMLLDARMQHTRWIAEVRHNQTPQVETDPSQCEFGKWLIAAHHELGELEEFKRLEDPHQALHMVYRLFKQNPGNEILREEVVALSTKLIGCIDRLEQRLNQRD